MYDAVAVPFPELVQAAMKIRMWRISRAAPFGLHLWFDPDLEVPSLRDLTDEEKSVRLDMPISVSESLSSSDHDGESGQHTLFHQDELPF